MLKQVFTLEPDARPESDFAIADHGSVITFHPLTLAAQEWWEEHVAYEPWQRLGNAYGIDPRYVLQLVEGIEAEGFTIA